MAIFVLRILLPPAVPPFAISTLDAPVPGAPPPVPDILVPDVFPPMPGIPRPEVPELTPGMLIAGLAPTAPCPCS
jgi:hypothetical protein